MQPWMCGGHMPTAHYGQSWCFLLLCPERDQQTDSSKQLWVSNSLHLNPRLYNVVAGSAQICCATEDLELQPGAAGQGAGPAGVKRKEKKSNASQEKGRVH